MKETTPTTHQSDIEIVRDALKYYAGHETYALRHETKDAVKALEALSRIEEATQWQSIESAPRDGTLVLLQTPYRKVADIGSFRTDYNHPDEEPQWFLDDGDDYSTGYYSTGYYSTPVTPTHWLPLPAAPEIGSARNE